MPKPNTRMTAMRQRALEAFAEGRTDDLTAFSTTALWEVARVQQRKGNRHALAGVLVELFNRTDPDDGTSVPIELRIHLPGMDAHVSETKPDTGRPVSDTPPLDLSPSDPPPAPKDYPPALKSKAVAMHRSGETRETIAAGKRATRPLRVRESPNLDHRQTPKSGFGRISNPGFARNI